MSKAQSRKGKILKISSDFEITTIK